MLIEVTRVAACLKNYFNLAPLVRHGSCLHTLRAGPARSTKGDEVIPADLSY